MVNKTKHIKVYQPEQAKSRRSPNNHHAILFMGHGLNRIPIGRQNGCPEMLTFLD